MTIKKRLNNKNPFCRYYQNQEECEHEKLSNIFKSSIAIFQKRRLIPNLVENSSANDKRDTQICNFPIPFLLLLLFLLSCPMVFFFSTLLTLSLSFSLRFSMTVLLHGTVYTPKSQVPSIASPWIPKMQEKKRSIRILYIFMSNNYLSLLQYLLFR